MGVFTTQGYSGKLVAGSEQTILDTFKDEEIKVSNNILDLFDLGEIPGTFTQTITLPGTKTNNAFFEHYYDISVYEPDLFNTNQKVQAYLDFDSFYLVNGFLQLKKVSVIENKFVDSYEVELFGVVSSFSVDTRASFLTDITSLSTYNHTSSLANITSSWNYNLFNGDIVYPLAEYGQKMVYATQTPGYGIDEKSGSLSVQDFKPAIRIKKVWDAIFNQFGYTYTGSFFQQDWLNNVYLFCNNGLRTPVYPVSIENYYQGRILNGSGSAIQNLTTGVTESFVFNLKAYDYNNAFTVGSTPAYENFITTTLDCKLDLAFQVSKSNATPGSGAPQFSLYLTNNITGVTATVPLDRVNAYMFSIADSRTTTVTETFNLKDIIVRTPIVTSGSLAIKIGFTTVGANNFEVNLNPDQNNGCAFEVTKVNQAADNQVLQIPLNMPAGNSGIRVIDFIRAVQKKFNLVIYGNKQTPNQFIVETFNDWYKNGRIVDFNQFINLKDKIEFTPANSLAYRQIKFQDLEDTDYVTTLFKQKNNRSYGESNFYDSSSFYSQGKLEVNSEAIASGPLIQIPGTGYTGSAADSVCTSWLLENTSIFTSAVASYTNCFNLASVATIPPGGSVTICARSTSDITAITGIFSATPQGNCDIATLASQYPMWVPTFIGSQDYTPARVAPRIMFYNNVVSASWYWISGYDTPYTGNINTNIFYAYPYFDNYSTGSVEGTSSAFPAADARSLLFNNEVAVLGSTPSGSLVSEYWNEYLALLYNPRTRLVECSAVIPLGDYVELELNDIVEFRGSYYHLRAINDYNLKTGECNLQLLGPIIGDTISSILSGSWAPTSDPCEFTFSASLAPTCNSFTATKLSTFISVATINWTDCYSEAQSVDLYNPAGVGEIETITFCAQSGSLSFTDTEISVIDNGPCAGKQWNNEPNLWNFNKNKWENA
jgi:hypothetical protein